MKPKAEAMAMLWRAIFCSRRLSRYHALTPTTNSDASTNDEVTSFWDVLFSPVAMNKFFHTVTSSFALASLFVVGVSAWYLLRRREEKMARKSIDIA